MPRGGKGGGNKRSHKGQRRQFTNEHNLQRQEELEKKQKEWRRKQGIESDSDEEEGGEDQPARASHAAAVGDLPPSDSDETDSDAEEKHKGVEHLIQVENPNRMGGRQTKKVTEIDKDDAKPQLSRRDREELEKQQAKANYRKLHEAGKTDEARADLARLALIRKQREETAKKREEERLAKEKANQKAQQKMMEKKGAN